MDAGAGRALFASDCDEVAWNKQSQKYLRRGNLDGRPVQMLIDTGCNQTVVSARLVDPANVQPQEKVPILCAHGDTVLYPSATVKLQAGPWERESRVVVSSNLPVDVLLGTDVYDGQVVATDAGAVGQSFAVLTRRQKQQKEQ